MSIAAVAGSGTATALIWKLSKRVVPLPVMPVNENRIYAVEIFSIWLNAERFTVFSVKAFVLGKLEVDPAET